ncbi:MAG: (Fe-S)-binding protein, partial [Promethearchaeia archaeon]
MGRPSPLDIYSLLDKSNCGDCGYDTCMAFATDLLEKKAKVEDCTHLMEDPKQKKKREKLIELITPPQRSVTIGVGDDACTIGGEEVMMRHQLTFWNQTAFFMEVADDEEGLEETLKYLDDLTVERIGETLKIQGIALRCVSGEADAFKAAAKKVSELTDLPMMLCCLDPEVLLAAAEEIKDKRPLLYAATKDTWEDLGTFAVKNDVPLVATSKDLDELMSLSATLQKLGCDDIVLDPGTYFGPGKIALTYDNIVQLRHAAIQKEDDNAGWPV